MAKMKSACSLDAVEGSIEHTCDTCDHYVDGWDGWHRTRCGLCWLKWQDMVCGTIQERLDIDRASCCMVDIEGCCDDWMEVESYE